MMTTSSSPQQNTPAVAVIATLTLLGLFCVALVVFVIILGYFVKRQRKEMNSMENKLAALDCHVKMHLALSRDSENKVDNGDEVPALPDKTRRPSAPGFLERRSEKELMHSTPTHHYQRKPSLPVNLQDVCPPFTELGNIQEEGHFSKRKAVPSPPHIKGLMHGMNQEILPFNPKHAKKTEEKKHTYYNYNNVSQFNADKDVDRTKQYLENEVIPPFNETDANNTEDARPIYYNQPKSANYYNQPKFDADKDEDKRNQDLENEEDESEDDHDYENPI